MPNEPKPNLTCPFCNGKMFEDSRIDSHHDHTYYWWTCCVCKARTGEDRNRTTAVNLALRRYLSKGVDLVVAERRRHVVDLGYTSNHDAIHSKGQMVTAGMCYAREAEQQLENGDIMWDGTDEPDPENTLSRFWPWGEEFWNPSPDPVRNLVKAASLMIAEIDRILDKREQTTKRRPR